MKGTWGSLYEVKKKDEEGIGENNDCFVKNYICSNKMIISSIKIYEKSKVVLVNPNNEGLISNL